MDVLVSGLAARAVFIEGSDVSYIDADRPDVRKPATWESIRFLLADAYDVVTLKRTTIEHAFEELLRSWNTDRGLRMLDMLLDSEEEKDIRRDAATYLSDILKHERARETILNRAYAVSLQSEIDLDDVLAPDKLPEVRQLVADQPHIKRVRIAWDSVPDRFFQDRPSRLRFENVAINRGLFRKLVNTLARSHQLDTFTFEALMALKDSGNSGPSF